MKHEDLLIKMKNNTKTMKKDYKKRNNQPKKKSRLYNKFQGVKNYLSNHPALHQQGQQFYVSNEYIEPYEDALVIQIGDHIFSSTSIVSIELYYHPHQLTLIFNLGDNNLQLAYGEIKYHLQDERLSIHRYHRR